MLGFSRKKIKSQKTVGEKLKSVRKRAGYNLEQVEKEIKVSLRYLGYLEKGKFEFLPAQVYVRGFLRRYAEFLELDSQKIISEYEKEKELFTNIGIFPKKNKDQPNLLKPNPSDKWLKTPGFIITPKSVFNILVVLVVLGTLSYIWYQVKGFAAAPPLEISMSSSQTIVNVESLVISGTTDASANLTINDQQVAVDPQGQFSQIIKLDNGINNIIIKSQNKANKVTTKVIKILAEY